MLVLTLLAFMFAFAKDGPRPRRVHVDPNVYFDCRHSRGSVPEGGTVQDGGFRLTYINGQLVKNMTMVAVPMREREYMFIKIWGPGFDPSDPYVPSDTVVCRTPSPRPEPQPAYFPDTY